MGKVSERYILLGKFPENSYTNAFYSYGSTYLNLSTAEGWAPQYSTQEYLDKIDKLQKSFKAKNCKEIKFYLSIINTSEIITLDEGCSTLKECGFQGIYQKSNICLKQYKE